MALCNCLITFTERKVVARDNVDPVPRHMPCYHHQLEQGLIMMTNSWCKNTQVTASLSRERSLLYVFVRCAA